MLTEAQKKSLKPGDCMLLKTNVGLRWAEVLDLKHYPISTTFPAGLYYRTASFDDEIDSIPWMDVRGIKRKCGGTPIRGAEEDEGFSVKHWQKGRHAIGRCHVPGVGATAQALDTKKCLSVKDARKLAALIAIEKMLDLADSKAIRLVLPAPVSATLRIVKKLVHLREMALEGNKNAKNELLKAAKDGDPAMSMALKLLKVVL